MIVPIYRDALSARHRLRRRPSLLFASRQWRRDAGSVAASDIDEISSTPTSCPMRPISLFLVLPLPSPFFLLFIFYISYFFYLNKMMRGAIRREKAIGKIFCFHGLICRLNEHWWLFFFAPVAIIDVVRSFSGQAEETIRIAAKIMRFIPPPSLFLAALVSIPLHHRLLFCCFVRFFLQFLFLFHPLLLLTRPDVSSFLLPRPSLCLCLSLSRDFLYKASRDVIRFLYWLIYRCEEPRRVC